MMFLALIPGIILAIVVWRADKIEKEPVGLLVKLFLLGALTIISAIVIGTIGEDHIFGFLDKESMLFIFIDNFILTAMVEEGGKYFVMKKVTWKHPAFDHTFDGVVYAVAASLGFATLENIIYLIDSDISIAIVRGILSVPGHVIYAVFMGYYYGLAKYSESLGSDRYRKINLRKAYFIPVLLHGFYDFCLSTPYDIFYLVFLVFEIVLTVIVIKRFRRMSRQDVAFYGKEQDVIYTSDTAGQQVDQTEDPQLSYTGEQKSENSDSQKII